MKDLKLPMTKCTIRDVKGLNEYNQKFLDYKNDTITSIVVTYTTSNVVANYLISTSLKLHTLTCNYDWE